MLPRDLIKRLGTFEIDHFDFEGYFEPDTPSDPHESNEQQRSRRPWRERHAL
jgi:hypothetical protein